MEKPAHISHSQCEHAAVGEYQSALLQIQQKCNMQRAGRVPGHDRARSRDAAYQFALWRLEYEKSLEANFIQDLTHSGDWIDGKATQEL